MVSVFERRSKRALMAAGLSLLVAAALLAPLVWPAGARAGEYHVYSCRTPSGETAPVDGWSGSVAAGGAFDDYATNTCGEGGALIAALGDVTIHIANVDRATWSFALPAGTAMSAATLWRAGDTAGGSFFNAFYQFWLGSSTGPTIFDECASTLKCASQGDIGQPLAQANRLEVPTQDLGDHL